MLAPIVVAEAIAGDVVAQSIVDSGAASAAGLVVATAARLALGNNAPLALAGGIACSGDLFRNRLLAHLNAQSIRPEPITVVTDPVVGSLVMARDRLLEGQ